MITGTFTSMLVTMLAYAVCLSLTGYSAYNIYRCLKEEIHVAKTHTSGVAAISMLLSFAFWMMAPNAATHVLALITPFAMMGIIFTLMRYDSLLDSRIKQSQSQ